MTAPSSVYCPSPLRRSEEGKKGGGTRRVSGAGVCQVRPRLGCHSRAPSRLVVRGRRPQADDAGGHVLVLLLLLDVTPAGRPPGQKASGGDGRPLNTTHTDRNQK